MWNCLNFGMLSKCCHPRARGGENILPKIQKGKVFSRKQLISGWAVLAQKTFSYSLHNIIIPFHLFTKYLPVCQSKNNILSDGELANTRPGVKLKWDRGHGNCSRWKTKCSIKLLNCEDRNLTKKCIWETEMGLEQKFLIWVRKV